MAALVDKFCIQNLSKTSIDFLLKYVAEYEIEVADEKIGDKPYLLKVVIRHLTSETVETQQIKGQHHFLNCITIWE